MLERKVYDNDDITFFSGYCSMADAFFIDLC